LSKIFPFKVPLSARIPKSEKHLVLLEKNNPLRLVPCNAYCGTDCSKQEAKLVKQTAEQISPPPPSPAPFPKTETMPVWNRKRISGAKPENHAEGCCQLRSAFNSKDVEEEQGSVK